MKEKVGIIGGDLRQKHMLETLDRPIVFFGNDSIIERGNHVKSPVITDLLRECNILIVPIPFSKDQVSIYARYFIETIPINLLLDGITSKHFVLGGPFSEKVKKAFQSRGARVIDITTLETFKMQNAIPTIEGVISELINRMDSTIHNSQGLIMGYGHCGKRLTEVLLGLGAKVEIYTENEIEKNSCQLKGIPCLGRIGALNHFDYVINTIPRTIFSLDELNFTRLMIDITDVYTADLEQLVQMRGIPGRFSPRTAGKIIGELINDVINNVMGEDG